MGSTRLPSDVSVEGMTAAQRVVLALDLLPQLEEEASRTGAKGGKFGKAIEDAANRFEVGASSLAAVRLIQKRDHSGLIITAMRSGKISIAEAARRAGFERLGQGSGRLKIDDSTHFGKGDKWKESMTPIIRYMRAWRKRDFRFVHVNFKEARRRLAELDELAADIERARQDLAQRADPAKLRL